MKNTDDLGLAAQGMSADKLPYSQIKHSLLIQLPGQIDSGFGQYNL